MDQCILLQRGRQRDLRPGARTRGTIYFQIRRRHAANSLVQKAFHKQLKEAQAAVSEPAQPKIKLKVRIPRRHRHLRMLTNRSPLSSPSTLPPPRPMGRDSQPSRQHVARRRRRRHQLHRPMPLSRATRAPAARLPCLPRDRVLSRDPNQHPWPVGARPTRGCRSR